MSWRESNKKMDFGIDRGYLSSANKNSLSWSFDSLANQALDQTEATFFKQLLNRGLFHKT